ncbi:unnamed protein product [Taenia asiatica]|uniref:Uncharacterized protein n=1 Tax=Taenia asiatica TaxID=60517 RepID=A0A0R3VY24_TAEAS|nr:unnamed protein product [Taenia asiatica]
MLRVRFHLHCNDGCKHLVCETLIGVNVWRRENLVENDMEVGNAQLDLVMTSEGVVEVVMLTSKHGLDEVVECDMAEVKLVKRWCIVVVVMEGERGHSLWLQMQGSNGKARDNGLRGNMWGRSRGHRLPPTQPSQHASTQSTEVSSYSPSREVGAITFGSPQFVRGEAAADAVEHAHDIHPLSMQKQSQPSRLSFPYTLFSPLFSLPFFFFFFFFFFSLLMYFRLLSFTLSQATAHYIGGGTNAQLAVPSPPVKPSIISVREVADDARLQGCGEAYDVVSFSRPSTGTLPDSSGMSGGGTEVCIYSSANAMLPTWHLLLPRGCLLPLVA